MTMLPVQFVAPLPPLKTGIAQYSEDLLDAVDGRWQVRVVAEPGSRNYNGESVTTVGDKSGLDLALPTVIQIGNSSNHRRAYELANRTDGILVLHDVVLHHARIGEFVARGKTREYLAEVERRYGPDGYRLGRGILAGRNPQDLLDFPMFEPFVERARVTIVHNEFARQQVLLRVPDAQVERAPMGIPLPALVDQADARRELGLPESAFIVASITHINPMKRLPVVLRAFRRVAAEFPEAVFVIAGSPSPEVNLELQVRILGLEGRVLLLGYVSDREARLLARASDACVNLRYPGTGETSASLLRLLGAGRPVLVTEGVASSELPEDVGLRVPVDRFEEELIAQLLAELAQNTAFRKESGALARRFVEREHSMGQAVDAYRVAIQRAYGIELPPAANPVPEEPAPATDIVKIAKYGDRHSALDQTAATALVELGLDRSTAAVEQVAHAMVELGLNRLNPRTQGSIDGSGVDPRLLSRLACTGCGGSVQCEGDDLVCSGCGTSFPVRTGVADFGEKPTIE